MYELFKIKEVSDLYADACLRHPQTGALQILSCYGRDGVVLSLLAAFSLPKSQGGLPEFGLVGSDGATHSVYVPEPQRLTKHVGRIQKTLFGTIVHAWIFDPDLIRPDRSNRTAWGLISNDEIDAAPGSSRSLCLNKAWLQMKDLSPVPLAEEWRSWVLEMAQRRRHLVWLDEPDTLHPPLGRIYAYRLDLENGFIESVSEAVRRGDLPIPAEARDMASASCESRESESPSSTPGLRQPLAPKLQQPVDLGRVVATPGVLETVPRDRLMECLERHRCGDWGELSNGDKRSNDAAHKNGLDRILSAYAIDGQANADVHQSQGKFWVITEWVDESTRATTVLLPSEY